MPSAGRLRSGRGAGWTRRAPPAAVESTRAARRRGRPAEWTPRADAATVGARSAGPAAPRATRRAAGRPCGASEVGSPPDPPENRVRPTRFSGVLRVPPSPRVMAARAE
jgi:hypothetical protein